jgi:hypothetical protein
MHMAYEHSIDIAILISSYLAFQQDKMELL